MDDSIDAAPEVDTSPGPMALVGIGCAYGLFIGVTSGAIAGIATTSPFLFFRAELVPFVLLYSAGVGGAIGGAVGTVGGLALGRMVRRVIAGAPAGAERFHHVVREGAKIGTFCGALAIGLSILSIPNLVSGQLVLFALALAVSCSALGASWAAVGVLLRASTTVEKERIRTGTYGFRSKLWHVWGVAVGPVFVWLALGAINVM